MSLQAGQELPLPRLGRVRAQVRVRVEVELGLRSRCRGGGRGGGSGKEDRLGFEAAAAAPAALYGAARAGRRSCGQRPWSAGQYAGL